MNSTTIHRQTALLGSGPPTQEPSAPADHLEVLPIDLIARSPLNPRKHFDQAALAELAASIREHGLQQPIRVRPTDMAHWHETECIHNGVTCWKVQDRRWTSVAGEYSGDEILRPTKEAAVMATPIYEVIMGERRLRACRAAGLTHVPCMVSYHVDDRTHVALALAENLIREDLDPIAVARAYQQLRDMDLTVEQIGKQVGVHSSTVANATRLLALPEEVLAMISAGILEPTHARSIIRYARFPKVAIGVANYVVERKPTARDLEKDMPWNMLYTLANAGVIMQVSGSGWQKACHACPFEAFRRSVDNAGYCCKPEHFEELRAADAALAEARFQKQAARLEKRADLEPHVAEKLAKSHKGGASPSGPPKVPRIRDLDHNTYERIANNPIEGCDTDCKCRLIALEWDGEPCQICIDPGHRRALKGQATRLRKARIRREHEEHVKDWLRVDLPADDVAVRGARVLATAVWNEIQDIHLDVRRAVARRLPDGELKNLVSQSNHRFEQAHAWKVLSQADAGELLSIVGEMKLREETRVVLDLGHDRRPAADFLLRPIKRVPPPDRYKQCPSCRGEMRLKTSGHGEQKTYRYECACGHCEVITPAAAPPGPSEPEAVPA